MKRALFFLLLLISFEGFGQVKQKPVSYGVQYNRVQADSALRIPTVTVGIKNAYAGLDTAQLYYNKSDSGVYVYTGSQWRSVGGSGSTPSLQQVTDVGSTTTNDITLDAGSGETIGFHNDGGEGVLEIGSSSTAAVYRKQNFAWSQTSPVKILTIGRRPTLANGGTIYFPDSSGTVALLSNIPTTIPISSLTAATGTNSIDNGGFQQAWAG